MCKHFAKRFKYLTHPLNDRRQVMAKAHMTLRLKTKLLITFTRNLMNLARKESV